MSPLQQFLVTGKGAPLADDLGAGVEKDIVGLHLDIEDAARRDAPQKAFPSFDVQHRAVRPGGQRPQRPFQLDRKGKVVHRLENVVKGLDRVSLDGILCQVGHKDDHDPGILFPDAAGSLDAQLVGQANVQKQQVSISPVILQQVESPGIAFQLIAEVGVLPMVSVQILRHPLRLCLVILQDADFHDAALLSATAGSFLPQSRVFFILSHLCRAVTGSAAAVVFLPDHNGLDVALFHIADRHLAGGGGGLSQAVSGKRIFRMRL